MPPVDSQIRNLQPEQLPHSSSFKDPSGFVFTYNGILYRQVNERYRMHYEFLFQSGLYQELVHRGWLIAHEETDITFQSVDGYKVIKPVSIRHISYPYEWSFAQLKEAALLTLKIAQKCLSFKMILKDATPFNIQFREGKPVFIDSLSFEHYVEGEPWVAYKQFCEMFLAPLALMSYGDEAANGTLIRDIHGLSIRQTSARLPIRSVFSSGLLVHIHFQSWFQGNVAHSKQVSTDRKLSLRQLKAMLSHLESAVHKLSLKPREGVWGAYYKKDVLGEDYVAEKTAIIERFTTNQDFSTAIDLGSNNGYFSKLLAAKGMDVVAVDSEHRCIDDLYRECLTNDIRNMLPLLIDLTNPTPSIGWMNVERSSFIDRFSADIVLALALVHHLVIGKNIPFDKVAQFCAKMGKHLIIEFVPKTDPKVQILLAHREDIFDSYTKSDFLQAFERYFTLKEEAPVSGTERILYSFHRK